MRDLQALRIMNYKLSKRSQIIKGQSEIRAMTLACTECNGINLSQGVCDTETPLPVLAGAKEAIDRGDNNYTRLDGIDELRLAIAHKEKAYKNIDVDPNSEVVVSNGATGGLYNAVMTLLDPGDEVVVFEPYYGYHVHTFLTAGVSINYVSMKAPDWEFKIEDLEKTVTSKTKAIMVNTPSNPCGKVFSKEELEAIGEIAEKNDLYIFSDEIYEYFVYDGLNHISPASIGKLKERTIIIGGFSKTFSVTGWRIGYTIAPPEITKILGQFNDLVYICPPAPLQHGITVGLKTLGDDHYQKLRADHFELREIFCSTLDKVGMTPYVPKGAYYVLTDISGLPGNNCKDKVMRFLDKTGVAGVPGYSFYHDNSGDDLVRFCFAKEKHVIEDACNRIEMAF